MRDSVLRDCVQASAARVTALPLEDFSGTYNVHVGGGTHAGRTVLSCRPDGHVDLWGRDDNSGRQKWILSKVADGPLGGVYNVRVGGGTNADRTVLSCRADGHVDLWARDDGSGRQKWMLEAVGPSTFNIHVGGGTNAGKKLLSCRADGHVDLWERDDSSGRQKWVMHKVRTAAPIPSVPSSPKFHHVMCLRAHISRIW